MEEDVKLRLRVTYTDETRTHKQVAERIAHELSIGTWTSKHEDLKRSLSAHVLHYDSIKKDEFIMTVGIPIANIDPSYCGISGIVNLLTGDVSAMKQANGIRIEEIILPKYFVDSCSGPKLGLTELMNRFRGKENKENKKPLLSVVIRPGIANTSDYPKIVQELFMQGADMVIDDRLTQDPSYFPLLERITTISNATKEAEKKTGKKKTYVANVTSTLKRTNEAIAKINNLENTAVYFDVGTMGFPFLEYLSRDENIRIPVGVFYGSYGMISRFPQHGIDLDVISTIIRLSGADCSFLPPPFGRMFTTREEAVTEQEKLEECLHSLVDEWYGIKSTLPAFSGGIHHGNIEANMKFYNSDVIFHIGGAIFSHPKGHKAGVKSMRNLIDKISEGKSTLEIAENDNDVKDALKAWRYVQPGERESHGPY